jgi:hypothetical protein
MANYKPVTLLAILAAAAMSGCQPRTTSEKVKDKTEDAAHETKQGMDRAGDRVKDATH